MIINKNKLSSKLFKFHIDNNGLVVNPAICLAGDIRINVMSGTSHHFRGKKWWWRKRDKARKGKNRKNSSKREE